MSDLPPLPPRPNDGHKGTFGTVCVVGGQVAPPRVMVGGPALSAAAALRVGAGLAVLALPEPIVPAGLTICPSATGLALPVDERGALRPSAAAEVLDAHAAGATCMAIGPGWGSGPPQQQMIARLVAQDHVPLVLDADALNALAAVAAYDRELHGPAILTPHPGEFRRLATPLGLAGVPTEPAERQDAARTLARRLGCVVVLKGAGTVVTDGQRIWAASVGNVALATAGTGDVLTGIIAGLVAQDRAGADLYEAARLGVQVHGLAADRWAARHGAAGLLATDLLAEIPGVLAGMPRAAVQPA